MHSPSLQFFKQRNLLILRVFLSVKMHRLKNGISTIGQ